ncbi:ATP-binding protein [Chloroflexota bacterium]
MMDLFSNPIYFLSPLVASAIIIWLLVLIWKKSQSHVSSQIFAMFLASLGLWSLFTFFMRNSPDIYHALPWDKALITAAIPAFALYYHFTLAYTGIQVKRWIVPAIYSIVAVLAVGVATTDFAVTGVSLESYGYAPIAGPLLYFSYAPMPFLIVGGTYNLLKVYGTSSSYEERNRLLFLALAAVFPLLGAGLDGFTNLPPAAIPSNLIFCVLCSIAILKYRLLDIRVVIRKGLVYLLVSVPIALPYLGALLLVQQVLQTQIVPWWAHAVIILIAAIAIRPMYTLAQQFVDRLFYRDRYDYLWTLERFGRETQSIENLHELGSTVVRLIKGAIRASTICLFLMSEDKNSLTVVSCDSMDKPQPKFEISQESLLAKHLNLHGTILSSKDLNINPALQGFASTDRQSFERMGAELYIPIKISRDKLSGILILGEKLGQQGYSIEDRQLLLSLASQIAMALENARLYDVEKNIRKELEILNEQKTEFLHNIAHELKTPLTVIISTVAMLDEESHISEAIKGRLVKNLIRSSHLMNGKVDQLLNFARIHIGQMEIYPKPTEVDTAISDIASQMSILFKQKGQTLKLEIPDSLPKAKVDSEKLEQVLLNLLSNANKFSPSRSVITLKAREVGGKVIITVEDKAPELSKIEKAKIFEPYYRGEDAGKRERHPGIGLGLSISKQILELHQEEIWVESKPGEGNSFCFSLPIIRE